MNTNKKIDQIGFVLKSIETMDATELQQVLSAISGRLDCTLEMAEVYLKDDNDQDGLKYAKKTRKYVSATTNELSRILMDYPLAF